MDRSRRILSMVLCTILYTALHICAAQAATFTCAGGDVACLIAAINTANGTPELDTIQLAAGDYRLMTPAGARGLPSITTPVTIQGQGLDVTVIRRDPSAPEFCLMAVEASGILTLDGLTLSGGGGSRGSCEGGAIANAGGTVTLSRTHLTRNRIIVPGGGGLSTSGGHVHITDSVIDDNFANYEGGGLRITAGELTVTRTTIARNGADAAGGVEVVGGTATISHSAIIDNNGVTTGTGGVRVSSGAALTLINSTVARNTAFGYSGSVGGLSSWGALTRVVNSTIVNNSLTRITSGAGGISGTMELQNTIIAHNTGLSGQALDCRGTPTSLGHNLIGDPTGCTIALQPSDLTGDPGLNAYLDDGQPGHGHYPLLAMSQAVDVGNPFTCPLTDQLGRQRSGPCDLGAVEFQPVLPPALTLTLNQSQFRTGETVRVALHVQQPGPTVTGDFYFGALLPDGTTALFISNEGWVQAGLDNPRAFRPLAMHAVLSQGLDLTFDPFFAYTFQGAEASGIYSFFALFTPPEAFSDGRIDAGDLLALELKSFRFSPSGLVAQLPANIQAIRDKHMNRFTESQRSGDGQEKR